MTCVAGRTIGRSLAVLGAVGVVAYARARWVGLRQAPAETPDTRPLGLCGFRAPAGDCTLFVRTQQAVSPKAEQRLPLVQVHGLVVSSKVMEPLMGRLQGEFRVFAPDLRGYGESRRTSRPAVLPDIADILARWLRGMGVQRVLLFGLSAGCNVAAELAARHPSLVDRLVLQGPGPDRRGRSLPIALWRDFAHSQQEPRPSWGIAKVDYAKAGLCNAALAVRMALRTRIEDILPHVYAPTLVICGSRDLVSPVPWAEYLTGLLPQGRLMVLEGAAHVLPYGAPDLLAQAMLPFLLAGAELSAA